VAARINDDDREFIGNTGLTVREIVETGIHTIKLKYKGLDFDWKKEDIQKRLFLLEKDSELHNYKIENLKSDIKNIEHKLLRNNEEIAKLKDELSQLNEKEEKFIQEIYKNI
jgi:chromosome segregation ATPase